MAPGRWNLAGEEAIYTSTEMGVPLLERLAHTSKNVIPSNLAMMKIKISGNWHTTGSKNIWRAIHVRSQAVSRNRAC
jgi:hypothetical protein